jgi:hypothetical protein
VSLSKAQLLRQQMAGRRRQNPNADISDLEALMPAAKREDYIARVVGGSPRLSSSQRETLALLLRSGGGPDVPAS